MKVIADARGFALVFETEEMLDRTIDHLQALRDWKRMNNKEYPAVFTYTSEALPKGASDALHDQAWWMGFSVKGRPMPGEPGGGRGPS